MRTIRFRAWDADEKEMVSHWQLVNDPDDWFRSFFDGTAEDGDVLMQFTEVYDRDGKAVYEGDRLVCTVNDEPIGEIDRVQFKDGEFRLANRDRSLRSWLYIEELYGKEVECNFYLAGNIYEHPDLLK